MIVFKTPRSHKTQLIFHEKREKNLYEFFLFHIPTLAGKQYGRRNQTTQFTGIHLCRIT